MAEGEFDRLVVQEPFVNRPHLVVLGAGATVAALPRGDVNGRKPPIMPNIVEVCGLGPILEEHGIDDAGGDFEAFFSSLVAQGKNQAAIQAMELAIFDYFADMELPPAPTLYDHLLLSLRPKDVIATFNWDPFLAQAIIRNQEFTKLPTVLFLHGNVAVGQCMRHKPTCVGLPGAQCKQCGAMLQASRLLYPVVQKNYNDDPFIAQMWSITQQVLRHAYLVTFFGYSAPKTDVEAISLFKSGWGETHTRDLEEIEIIDIKEESELYRTWEPFIFEAHYTCTTSFYDSIIGNHPRRSCDAMFTQFMDAQWIHNNPLPREAAWDQLHAWLRPLIVDEEQYARKHPQTS